MIRSSRVRAPLGRPRFVSEAPAPIGRPRGVVTEAEIRDLMTPTPMGDPFLVDVKGHVNHVGHNDGGVHMINFSVRDGKMIMLRLSGKETATYERLVAARKSGECIELFYKFNTAGFIIEGDIISVC